MVDLLGRTLLLPPPLDNAWGDLLLLLAFWVAAAGLAALFVDKVLRRFADRSAMLDEALQVSQKPLVGVIVLFGAQAAFRLVAETGPPIMQTATGWVLIVTGLGLLAVGAYWAYKVYEVVLIHTAKRWADRSDSDLDRVLVPLGEKVGLVVVGIFALVTALATLGIDITMLAAGAGVGGLVIAFAAQDTLANYFSGLFLLIDQPFKRGDWIRLSDGEIVRVEDVGLRSSEFYHAYEHTMITVPNRMIAEDKIVDMMEPDHRYRLELSVGIAYGDDIEQAMRILEEVVRDHPHVLTEPEDLEPLVIFEGFGASSLDFTVLCWLDHFEHRFQAKTEINKAIDAAFDDAGLEIPFPQRDLWFRGDEGDGGGEGAGSQAAEVASARQAEGDGG